MPCAVHGHAHSACDHMRLAIACGLRSHAAQVRTQLALSCSSRSHAARRRAPPPKLAHGLVMTSSAAMLWRKRELARFLAPPALGQQHRARPEHGVCELADVSQCLGPSERRERWPIQRWQSQAGRAGARQASVQQAARPRAHAHRVHELLANEKRDGPSDHRRGRSRALPNMSDPAQSSEPHCQRGACALGSACTRSEEGGHGKASGWQRAVARASGAAHRLSAAPRRQLHLRLRSP